MYTKEPKLKKFVNTWNKRNARIKVDEEKDKVLITYTLEKKVIKLQKEDKIPNKDGKGPRSGSQGSRDGRGAGQGRAGGKGTGKKTGGKKGSC